MISYLIIAVMTCVGVFIIYKIVNPTILPIWADEGSKKYREQEGIRINTARFHCDCIICNGDS